MRRLLLILGILFLVLVILQLLRHRPASLPPNPPPPGATSMPASHPLSFISPSLPSLHLQSYTDLLHTLPGLQQAAPSDTRLSLDQAAHLKLPYPCYICPRGDLWISHPQSTPLTSSWGSLPNNQVHLCPEEVLYVAWRDNSPTIIIRQPDKSLALLRPHQPPQPLSRSDYLWPSALTFGDNIVVPTSQGVAVISLTPTITQSYRQLSSTPGPSPQVILTRRGFLAWLPSTSSIMRYADNQWLDNFATGDWSHPILQLIPLTDGSILQIRSLSPGQSSLAIVPLESAPTDPTRVRTLASQLGDDSPDIRNQAHAQLAAMGPSAWKTLEEFSSTALPEAQLRIADILRNRQSPQLGRFRPVDNRLSIAWRLADGGVILLLENGVTFDPADPQSSLLKPAWLIARPGRPFEVLPPALPPNLVLGISDLAASPNDWFISDISSGARILFGQELLPLTSPAEIPYRKLQGVDRLGRILLTTPEPSSDFLLIDPLLPDPTPSLTIWTMPIQQGSVGWDSSNFPAIKRESSWVLLQDRWQALQGVMALELPPSSTLTTPQQTLLQIAHLPKQTTLWLGQSSLELHSPSAPPRSISLPANLPGQILAATLQSNHLYLLHQGAISRLKFDPTSSTPLTLEAIFTEDVPKVAGIKRMWVDPANRICITTTDAQLIIIYTDGKIPQAMLDLIPSAELKHIRPK